MINALSPWAALLKEEISTGDIIIVHPSYSMYDRQELPNQATQITALGMTREQ